MRPAAQRGLLPGEVHLHWKALVPFLVATLAAFPFDSEPILMPVMGLMVLVAFGIRLYTPILGPWLARGGCVLVVAVTLLRLATLPGSGLTTLQLFAQTGSIISLLLTMVPPGLGFTSIACTISLMAVSAAGLSRVDAPFIAAASVFLLTLPGAWAFAHLHEVVRVEGLSYRSSVAGLSWAPRLRRHGAHALALAPWLAGAVAVHALLPVPGWIPLDWPRFSGPSNSLMQSMDVGQSRPPTGGRPFLRVAASGPVSLVAQVFDRYDGRRWVRTPVREKVRLERSGVFDLPPGIDAHRPAPGPAASKAVIELFWELPDLLPFPEGALRLRMKSWHLLGCPPLYVRSWSATPLSTYAVEYLLPAPFDELGPPHSVATAPPTTAESEVPPGLDGRVVELARGLAAGQRTQVGRVQAIARYLGHRYVYDTSALTPRKGDPLVHFLLEARRGFCEHFATALAVMARVAGVPSRLVIGYAPGDPTPPPDGAARTGLHYALVRPRDAHAWTLVHIDGHGWVSADATTGIRHVALADRFADWVSGGPVSQVDPASWAPPRVALLSSARRLLLGHPLFTALAIPLLVAAFVLVGQTLLRRLESRRRRRALGGVDPRDSRRGSGAVEPLMGGRARPLGPRAAGGGPTGPDPAGLGAVERAELSEAFDRVARRLAVRGLPPRTPDQTPLEYAHALASLPRTAWPPMLEPFAARILSGLESAARGLVHLLLGPGPPSPDLDARVRRDLALLEGRLSGLELFEGEDEDA